MSKFYITTPIYYPTDEPHIGHVYTTLCADTLARYHRLAGDDTFFLTGTDEHGVKMVKEAEKKGLGPRELADNVAPVYQQVWKELGITHNDFIRTTEVRHTEAARKIVERMVANDDIYLGSYEGWYDEGQEEFVTETEAKANDYKSAISKRPLTRYSEPTYFFRLGKYVPRVMEHIEKHAHFIRPEGRRNEVISKLKQGVADLSVSRATLKWGIVMPHDPEHVLYVWIDALSNYITALGYGSNDDEKFRKYWPADVHLIGKDILWFHAVYWPAMLFSLGLEPPVSVVAHGWFKSGGQKMGKSLGNFIDLEKIRAVIAKYGQDSMRYFLVRPVPFGEDPDWSELEIHKAHNELKNVVGNCLNRVLTMVSKYRSGTLPAAAGTLEDIDRQLIDRTRRLGAELSDAYERCALAGVRAVAHRTGAGDQRIHRLDQAILAGQGSEPGAAAGYGVECVGAGHWAGGGGALADPARESGGRFGAAGGARGGKDAGAGAERGSGGGASHERARAAFCERGRLGFAARRIWISEILDRTGAGYPVLAGGGGVVTLGSWRRKSQGRRSRSRR